jgi:hypothetical protein
MNMKPATMRSTLSTRLDQTLTNASESFIAVYLLKMVIPPRRDLAAVVSCGGS